ncbi:MAG: ABC transporter substrate-binding protein [Clostridia bacterium]|nr:ABC transporter substrate-binding protein [Clostridia bacterium]
MKKMLALLLAAMMLLAVVPVFAEGPVEITMLLEGNNVTDDAAVLEKLNAYLAEKIGVTLKPTWGTWGNFDQLALDYVNSSRNEYDILFTCSWTSNEYAKYAKKDAYVRLDDPEDNLLEKYGADLTATLPELLFEGAKTEGIDGEKGIYAVPGFKDFATMNTWDVNVTLLEKYGYTLEDVKNAGFYGWGDIFKTVKEGEEKDGEVFYPFVFEGAVVERFVTGTPIVTGDSNSLLSYYMNTEDVSTPGAYGNVFFNKYATPEFEKFVKQMREYYLAGYIDPAIAIGETATDTWRNAQNTARYLISSEVSLYGYEYTTSEARGIQVAYLMTTDAPYIDNTSVQGAMMAISSKSEHPEEAMKFLNLLNTDPYVMTLLNYGVEGIHYTLNDAGEVEFIPEARATYSPWTNGVGNVTILPPQKGQGADFQQRFAEFYAGSKKLPIYGFTFDSKPVEIEIAAVVNVKEAYALSLCTGAVDPETALPELLAKLEAAGMQKIVDEANAQLKTFLGE